ncbi:MAG TPA: hypothetical protein VMD27_04635 [Candidatus Aquilonibacter sp.]|nr:hypothetical protein [Candidatus Aquilonibacter sp.]
MFNFKIAVQFLFGDPFVPYARNCLEQSPLDQPEHGFVINLQQAGHLIGGVYFHSFAHILGVAAPHQQGTKPLTRLFSVKGFKKTDLVEMHSPGQWMAGLLEKTVSVNFVVFVRLDKFFDVRVLNELDGSRFLFYSALGLVVFSMMRLKVK